MCQWAYYEMVYQQATGIDLDSDCGGSLLTLERASSLESIQLLTFEQLQFHCNFLKAWLSVMNDDDSGAHTFDPTSETFSASSVTRLIIMEQLSSAISIVDPILLLNATRPEVNTPIRKSLLRRAEAVVLSHYYHLRLNYAQPQGPEYPEMGSTAEFPDLASQPHAVGPTYSQVKIKNFWLRQGSLDRVSRKVLHNKPKMEPEDESNKCQFTVNLLLRTTSLAAGKTGPNFAHFDKQESTSCDPDHGTLTNRLTTSPQNGMQSITSVRSTGVEPQDEFDQLTPAAAAGATHAGALETVYAMTTARTPALTAGATHAAAAAGATHAGALETVYAMAAARTPAAAPGATHAGALESVYDRKLPQYPTLGTHHVTITGNEMLLQLAMPYIGHDIQYTPSRADLPASYVDRLDTWPVMDIMTDPVFDTVKDPAASHCRDRLHRMAMDDAFYSDSAEFMVLDAIYEYLDVCRCVCFQQALVASIKTLGCLWRVSHCVKELVSSSYLSTLQGSVKWFLSTAALRWMLPVRSSCCAAIQVNVPEFCSMVDAAYELVTHNSQHFGVLKLDSAAKWLVSTRRDNGVANAWYLIQSRYHTSCHLDDIFETARILKSEDIDGMVLQVQQAHSMLSDFRNRASQSSPQCRDAQDALFLQSTHFTEWCRLSLQSCTRVQETDSQNSSSPGKLSADDRSTSSSSFESYLAAQSSHGQQQWHGNGTWSSESVSYKPHGDFLSTSLSPPRFMQVDWALDPLSRYTAAVAQARYRLEGDDWLSRMSTRFPSSVRHNPSRPRQWLAPRYHPTVTRSDSMLTSMSSSMSSDDWDEEQPLASWMKQKLHLKDKCKPSRCQSRTVIPVSSLPAHCLCPSSSQIAASAANRTSQTRLAWPVENTHPTGDPHLSSADCILCSNTFSFRSQSVQSVESKLCCRQCWQSRRLACQKALTRHAQSHHFQQGLVMLQPSK